ncbi:WD40 repeat-like protein [Gyrodon lividus]|nr:WD40 repeat-like protein [Gyrodon lividus]
MSRLYDSARNAYWRVRGLPVPSMLRGHTGTISSVEFLADGKQVISGSEDGSVRVWRVKDGREVETVMKEGHPVLAATASSDGRWIATGGIENKITIWNATTHEKVVELEGHSDLVWSLAFSPNSGRVVSGSHDGMVILWNTTTGERLVGPLQGHTQPVWSVSFSPNGEEIATCDMCDIQIRYSHSGELVIPPIGVDAVSLTWTPNGQPLLIAGCSDGSIKLFDSSTGITLEEWTAHTASVHTTTFSRNGKFIASCSLDHTVRLWDTTTRQKIGPSLQHDDLVLSVAISPDGSHLVSGGRDKKVRIWSLKGIIPPSLLENTSNNAPADVSFHVSIRLSHIHLHAGPRSESRFATGLLSSSSRNDTRFAKS